MTSFREDLERLRKAFSAPEGPRGREPPGVSAVLLPLFEVDGRSTLLYTRRAANLRSHAGEVSFPGGRVDPTDEGPRAAAIREAGEEVGIRPEDVTVLGHLCDYMTYRGVLVCAYVAHVEGTPPTVPASPEEVAAILPVRVDSLLDPAVYEGRTLVGSGRDGVVHYWHLPEATIWGITGELSARFLREAYGWAPPRPPRPIREIHEFLPTQDGADPASRG